MDYDHEVILDIDKDAKNWFDASREPVFQGCYWRDYLYGIEVEFFDYLVQQPPQEAKQKIKSFLKKKYETSAELFEQQKSQITRVIDSNFVSACEWIKKTTRRPLVFKKYKIFLTTFPRSPYDADNGSFFMNIYKKSGYINTFLHEALHFQFIYYWRNNSNSPVSKMSEGEFEALKEALVVVIDEDAVPPADFAEIGYIKRDEELRHKLHAKWARSHDFDALVEYGVSLIT